MRAMGEPAGPYDFEERLLVDTSEQGQVYLLAARNGGYLRLSPSAYHLLRKKASGASSEALAADLSEQMGKLVSPDEVDMAHQHVLERIKRFEDKPQDLPDGFWLRIRLLPGALIERAAGPLSYAFHPAIAGPLLLGILAAAAMAPDLPSRVDPSTLGYAYLLFFLSLFAHELGHASACARYGARPSDIGFALYLLYPCLYSDVSAAWTLKRWQRVVVDLGGVFFQLLAGAIYLVAYALSGWAPLLTALLFIAGNCVFSLNPIFKFDGYWVVADALGVTNLGRQPAKLARHWVNRLLRRPAKPMPWPLRVTAALSLYTLLSVGVWIAFLGYLVPQLGGQLLAYPALAASLGRHLLDGQTPLGPGAVASFAFSTYVATLALLILVQMSRMAVVSGRALWRRRAGLAASAATKR